MPCDRLPRVLGCGRSSMAELRDVTPPVPVRLRPVTPKRTRHRCVANSSGRVPGSYPGMSGFEPLATHQFITPSWRNRQTHRSQKPGPATGMSVRLGPRGPLNSSPVAQRQSSALIRRRPVDRAHPGRPVPTTAQDVCHEDDRRRRRELSRSRASAARASRLKPQSSAVTAWCAA